MSQEDFFVSLSERRLNQSLERVKAANTRAVTLLSLLSILMSGVWALSLKVAGQPRLVEPQILLGFALLTAAMLLCGGSLLLSAEYDSPRLEQFYGQFFGAPSEAVYSAYFAAVIGAVSRNNRVIRLKSELTVAAIVVLLAALIAMAAIPISA